MSAEPVLKVRNLSIDYAPRRGTPTRAVRSFDLDVARGEVIGLVGESGTGKSTAALGLLALVRSPGKVVSGSVEYGGRNLLKLTDQELQKIRGNDISLIMQNPRSALNPMLRIGKQIANVIRAHSDLDAKAARERATDMLRLVGINDPQRRLDAYPHELSGGMAQRVLIATALSCRPKVLIADEPTSGLDVTIQAQILDDLARSAAETGSAAIIVTQDLGVVANYCDRVVVMYAGQVVELASAREFFARQAHPASRALVAASAKLAGSRLGPHPEGEDLESVKGCLLHPRCPWNDQQSCVAEQQELLEIAGARRARCHRWESVMAAPLDATAAAHGALR